jgi:acyl-CoA reductase-like NAD-dependent aldehyde dehydrogenase
MTRVTDAVKVNPEQRMLIDGKLVEAGSGKTFENVNPATEEVIGSVADASTAEMHRAIDSSRRAFDETDWSTNHTFRKHCLEQLHEELLAEQQDLGDRLTLLRLGSLGPLREQATVRALRASTLDVDVTRMSKNEWRTRNEPAGIGIVSGI